MVCGISAHALAAITALSDADLPSDVAVMVAVPTATPVTSPELLTVAMPALLLDQVTVRPVSGLLPASRGVAVMACDSPTDRATDDAESVTEATVAAVTVTLSVAVCPSEAAVTTAVPTETPETVPDWLTIATPVLLLDHETLRPVSGLPLASRGVAVTA